MKTEIVEKLEHVEGEVMHLFTEQTIAADSVIPLRWCICKETLNELKKRGAENIHLLIVVTSGSSKKEIRELVPINNLMTYIQFERPGAHIINATIVWADKGKFSFDNMKNYFLSQESRGVYRKFVTDSSGLLVENPSSSLHDVHDKGRASQNINVSEKFFAPEPRSWLKWWGNLWHKYPPVDQCEFRKRLGIAFGLKSFAVLLYIPAMFLIRGIIALSMLFCGFRGINFRPIVRVFKYKTAHVSLDTNGSVFSGWKWPLSPISILVFGLVFYALNIFLPESRNLNIRQIISIIAVILVLLCTFSFLLITLFGPLFGNLGTRWEKRTFESRWRKMYASVTCPGIPLKASIKALPWRHITTGLLFRATKRKVCKPYAQS